MRYSSSHKDQTRRRIVDVSSRLFKERGFDATGLATIMREADLTNGAFYAHFASKEALIEAVIADQIQQQIESFQNAPKDISGAKAIVDIYLTPDHRDNCGAGCPSAALLEEIGRRADSTKKVYNDTMMQLVDSLQEYFPDLDSEQARSLIFAIISLLIGTLQLARAFTDEDISDQILKSGREAATTLLDRASL